MRVCNVSCLTWFLHNEGLTCHNRIFDFAPTLRLLCPKNSRLIKCASWILAVESQCTEGSEFPHHTGWRIGFQTTCDITNQIFTDHRQIISSLNMKTVWKCQALHIPLSTQWSSNIQPEDECFTLRWGGGGGFKLMWWLWLVKHYESPH